MNTIIIVCPSRLMREGRREGGRERGREGGEEGRHFVSENSIAVEVHSTNAGKAFPTRIK